MIPSTVLKLVLWRGLESSLAFCKLELLHFSHRPNKQPFVIFLHLSLHCPPGFDEDNKKEDSVHSDLGPDSPAIFYGCKNGAVVTNNQFWGVLKILNTCIWTRVETLSDTVCLSQINGRGIHSPHLHHHWYAALFSVAVNTLVNITPAMY